MVPDSAIDPDLVAAYRGGGDERAAAELVRRHAAPLGRFLFSLGAPPSEIEDLVQEVFFRAFRRLDGWRGEASLRSWLFTIASNLLRDEHRKRRGRHMVSIIDHDVADDADPAAQFAATDTEERLRAGLARLPRLQREVFLRRIQAESSYEEIAVALGTTPGAARVHYHYAVKRLKELVR